MERPVDEVNFWQPSGNRQFHAVTVGAPFFFRLKQPHNAIAGFGYFSYSDLAPAWLAWQSFGDLNGARTFEEMALRISRYRQRFSTGPITHSGDSVIGCLMVSDPVFFDEREWVRQPRDWAPNIVQGKTYTLMEGEGLRIFTDCLERTEWQVPIAAPVDAARLGKPVLVHPRLGQGTFRLAVTDAYDRACAVTREHSLPVLEAAHIRPFAQDGPHAVTNGLLLRADLHRLFDTGYMTVSGDYRVKVSESLVTDFNNGREYLVLAGRTIAVPRRPDAQPDRELLDWHGQTVFRG